jgi:hypothetical protein
MVGAWIFERLLFANIFHWHFGRARSLTTMAGKSSGKLNENSLLFFPDRSLQDSQLEKIFSITEIDGRPSESTDVADGITVPILYNSSAVSDPSFIWLKSIHQFVLIQVFFNTTNHPVLVLLIISNLIIYTMGSIRSYSLAGFAAGCTYQQHAGCNK